ncbi:MAG TPA: hypothetical protein VMW66_06020 [Elusimicrobiales bacterium]|nr:hypothetical protein [Elusimicrobiales bacterium]
MRKLDLSKSKNKKKYKVGDTIKVNDLMQKGYSYRLVAPMGKIFAVDFKPEVSPAKMLKLGVFEGHYLNDCHKEFPKEWFLNAVDKLSPKSPDITKNYFKIKSRQSLQEWRRKEWILPNDPDPRGWFQWYCRYYIGRRIPETDQRQIQRWRLFRRHRQQVVKNCPPKSLDCRPRQRQALLQWAYNPFI